MTTPTPMSPPGIALLGSVREIFELAGVIKQLDNGELRPKLLDISPHEEYEVEEDDATVEKDVSSKKNQESIPLLPSKTKSIIEDDSEDEETENNATTLKVENDPSIKKNHSKSFPISASKGEPNFEMGNSHWELERL